MILFLFLILLFPLTANAAPVQSVLASYGGFSPTHISGLRIWLDASDASQLYTDDSCTAAVVSDGDAVGCWKDKSGNSSHIIQATAGNKPTYKTAIQNGRSVVRTDGSTADFLKGSAFSLQSTTATIFIALKKVSSDGGGAPFVIRDSDASLDYDNVASGVFAYVGGGDYRNGAKCTGVFPGDTNVTFIWTSKYDATDNNCYENGGLAGTPVGSTGTFSAEVITVGKRDTEDLYYTADYYEILVYDSALSDANRTSVRDYLNSKWAVY